METKTRRVAGGKLGAGWARIGWQHYVLKCRTRVARIGGIVNEQFLNGCPSGFWYDRGPATDPLRCAPGQLRESRLEGLFGKPRQVHRGGSPKRGRPSVRLRGRSADHAS